MSNTQLPFLFIRDAQLWADVAGRETVLARNFTDEEAEEARELLQWYDGVNFSSSVDCPEDYGANRAVVDRFLEQIL